ncbi:HesB/YadR/YfhF family protein [Aquibacillus sediminis]|uniref:HesB/YadR/YfhF family protein n=1 Tax=Aquibacillus sediminis TaxID=2574734 RepID=UPI0011085286|nr:hypothetical protein [Aquibacillus sediminis]
MSFSVTKEAAQWYKDEMGLEAGDHVRFFVKLYGGIKTAHPSYFLGVEVAQEGEIAIKEEVEGITFYFNKEDAWLLDDYDLKIEMGQEETVFQFSEKQ